MPLVDLPLEQLRAFAPNIAEPADFDAFWSRTIDEARALAGDVLLESTSTPITQFIVEDLTFPGFSGSPIRGWITRPKADRPLPTVIEFVGYTGGRGTPGERLQWAAAGFVHVLMDTRGQGSGWGSGGDTPDPHGSGPAVAGFMTRGIDDPDEYYYRRVFTDGIRLVDAVVELPFVEDDQIVVTGGSQGGGISLAVAALHDRVRAVMPDVPFLCHFRRAVELAAEGPFTELTRYLSVHPDHEERVFRTLSYFDGANFCRRITAPAYFSAGLMDTIVLPSTVFSAYNLLASADRAIEVYNFNGHEGGQIRQWAKQVAWLERALAPNRGSLVAGRGDTAGRHGSHRDD
jgi:cephalosporin-C deacetylase